MFIYKITNLINGKVYIGLTTKTIETRWCQHKSEARKGNKRHLYCSMRNYGIENFKIEEIDRTDNIEMLGKLERYYIKLYESRNPLKGYNIGVGGETSEGDKNPRAKLSDEEVEEIRILYGECEIGGKEAWLLYKDRISFSAFEKLWEGTTWKRIKYDVYTKENKDWHKNNKRKYYGETNVNAIFSDDEVLEIRKYYVNHTLKECYEKFGKNKMTKKSFRSIIDRSYLHLPIYRKKWSEWVNFLDGESHKIRTLIDDIYEIKDNLLYITVYDDYAKNSQTYITNAEYENIVRQYKWHISKDELRTTIDNRSVSLKSLILNGKKNELIYFFDGNKHNCCKENLTKYRCDIVFKNCNIEEFRNDIEKISIRKMCKKYNTTREMIKDFVVKNNINKEGE